MKMTLIKKILAAVLMAATVLTLIPFAAFAEGNDAPFEGAGTKESPFLIKTKTDLETMAELLNDTAVANDVYRAAYYQMTADITLNTVTNDDWTSAAVWTPMASASKSKPFHGEFDGNGYSISGMYVNASTTVGYAGLFAYVHGGIEGDTNGAAIRNLTVKNSKIAVTANTQIYVGGIVGYTARGVIIENCHTDIDIDVQLSASVTLAVGGILGRGDTATQIVGCSNSGDVTTTNPNGQANHWVGGIAGLLATLAAGDDIGSIERSFNTGAISCSTVDKQGRVGGIAGQVGASVGNTGSVSYCYNTGDVSGYYVGGLLGYTHATTKANIANCFSKGSVSWILSSGTSAWAAKGVLVGYGNNINSITNCYYSTETALYANGAPTEHNGYVGNNNGATALAPAQFVSENMGNLDRNVWTMNVGQLPTPKNVYADVYDYGASILTDSTIFTKNGEKIAEGQGLKFAFVINASYIDNGNLKEGYEVGVVISKLGAQMPTVESCEYKIVMEKSLTQVDGLYIFSGYLIGIPAENLDTLFVAKAYIDDGEGVIYSDSMIKSVRGEASIRGITLDANGNQTGNSL